MSRLAACCVTIILAAFAVGTALATGCGEMLPEGSSCSEWQCTRNVSGFCVRGLPLGSPCLTTQDCYLDLKCDVSSNQTNATTGEVFGTCTTADGATKNTGIGLVGAVLGVLCFGSSFVPIKKYKRFAGDGVFAQFLMNFGRFVVGLIIMFTRTNRWFYWEAAGGGAIWALGNALGVPIVQLIGVGLGVSIWGCTNMLLGWASGHWGLLGVKQEFSSNPTLEYVSVAFSFLSIILFIFVKPVQQLQHQHQKPDAGEEAESDHSEGDDETTSDSEKKQLVKSENTSEYSALSMKTVDPAETSANRNSAPAQKSTMAASLGAKRARILGVGMALAAGALFGICMDPAQRLMSNYDTLTADADVKYSPYGLDYVFSNNCGALAMSAVLLLIHTTLHNFNLVPFEKFFDPVEHGKLLLPAIVAGAIGSCGSAAWFFANQNLGLVVSFPIVAAGPGVVSSLWGAIVFHEVKGLRNFIILAVAFACVIAAGVCSSLSK
mmetsp:Transcript_10472/g.11963  ORF Transcript_10472/g.11963 Transcript_10472/m.11963 type:complete len:492 (-) Transcript_10472:162-1637(-)